uniref:hypothetical protein n=1 Tax=Ningiella ruwaisensis TaxID=2364274 RepID=UPI00109F89D6|nr:hypothetical protein [Ningiella ruwaisensis]
MEIIQHADIEKVVGARAALVKNFFKWLGSGAAYSVLETAISEITPPPRRSSGGQMDNFNRRIKWN